jgi:hypothetical protein
MRHADPDLVEPERLQVRLHDLRRPKLPIAELRVLVEVSPPRDDLLLDGLGRAVDLAGE